MHPYQKEILTAALEAREKEVVEYQVNIDNFKRAIGKCYDDPELADFQAQLNNLLKSSLLEQKKARLMYEVIKEQLECGTP